MADTLVDQINDRLGYDADITDGSQYCIHGTFMGSWWGPDYLCGLCEQGMDTRINITYARDSVFFADQEGEMNRNYGDRTDWPPPRYLRSKRAQLEDDFKELLASTNGEIRVTAYRNDVGEREVKFAVGMPDRAEWGVLVNIGRRGKWVSSEHSG